GVGALKIAVDGLVLGGRHSGVQTAVEHLALSLGSEASSHEVGLVCTSRFKTRARQMAGLTPVPAPGYASYRPGRVLYETLFLGRQLKKRDCDILHAPAYILPESWSGPSVLTVYDLIALDFPQWCKTANALHFRLRLPRSIRAASAVIAPSETTADAIRRRFPEVTEKIRVVPLGIGEEFERVEDPERLQQVRDRYSLPEQFILYVGNIEPKKNIAGMVEAFERVADDIDHHFILAGGKGWKCRKDLKRIEQSPYRERIRVTDWVAQEDLVVLYTLADILVQWSLYEGVGLPPLEAMRCATAAVVSDGGALPELAGQVAQVVPLGSAENLAEVLRRLLKDEQARAQIAKTGREFVRQFSWHEHARTVIELYEEVAGG
ncbi:MAG: glycosyltransferase family 4 protein, partial [Armatimonadota bacterium]